MFTTIYTTWLKFWEIFPNIFNMLMQPIPKELYRFMMRVPFLPNGLRFIYQLFGVANMLGQEMLWFDLIIATGILCIIMLAALKLTNDIIKTIINMIGAIWDLIPFA